ncbi:MAG: DUF4129 domain-containing protein [Verrucomicrobiae bacterium]|nr:DUF4129 domain-containing protein [Verrucomicrobiae bacterium]
MPSPAVSTSAASTPASPRARRRRRRDRDQSTGALQIAEEAFQLLRTTPAAGLWQYYLGTVPFVLAAFYFWADMSRSSHAKGEAAFGATVLTLAYFWMKGWQGLFCRTLWERLHPSGRPLRLSRGRFLRHLAAQAFIHAFALPIRLISLVFIGWTYAFFQNASVLAFTQDFGRQPLRRTVGLATRFAHQQWGQNYLILLLMSVIAFFVWLNMMGSMTLIPMALKISFGIESAFTINPESTLMNTTFLFATFLLTFLVVDPMMKAIYTLRCFRGLSRTTGTDLLSRLARVQSKALATAALAIALFAHPSIAQETPPSPPAAAENSAKPVTPSDLQNSIEETLRQKKYQWRYPRQAIEGDADSEKGWLARQLSALADSIERSVKRLGKALESLMKRLFENDGARSRRHGTPGEGVAEGIGIFAKVLLIAVVAALITWVIILIVRRAGHAKPLPLDDGGLAGPIDLESETILATQLPEDEWMRLAREQIAKGEHRLAVRALFLASLAHLGDRGLLGIARFKSNRDYVRELLLKARSLPELRAAFGENVRLFEWVWYGLHEIGQDSIDRFIANYERITRITEPAPGGAAPAFAQTR